jgi:hypothetical protein
MTNAELFDTMIIEFQKDGKAIASIAIDAEQLDGLKENFGQGRSEIIENMILTLQDEYQKRQEAK